MISCVSRDICKLGMQLEALQLVALRTTGKTIALPIEQRTIALTMGGFHELEKPRTFSGTTTVRSRGPCLLSVGFMGQDPRPACTATMDHGYMQCRPCVG